MPVGLNIQESGNQKEQLANFESIQNYSNFAKILIRGMEPLLTKNGR